MELKTVLIIGAIIFLVFWLKANQPTTYDKGVEVGKDLFEWGKKQISKENTTETPTKEGGITNYGMPYSPYECISDDQCQYYFDDVDNIKCNVETGECYTGG